MAENSEIRYLTAPSIYCKRFRKYKRTFETEKIYPTGNFELHRFLVVRNWSENIGFFKWISKTNEECQSFCSFVIEQYAKDNMEEIWDRNYR